MALQTAMPFSFLCKCSLGMSSSEAFKWPLQWLRWLWIYSQSVAAHKHRHPPFPHPKSEPHRRCPNPQRKVEETDTLLLFSRANLHQLQLPSEDLHLDTIFSSGVFFPSQTFQVKILSKRSQWVPKAACMPDRQLCGRRNSPEICNKSWLQRP